MNFDFLRDPVFIDQVGDPIRYVTMVFAGITIGVSARFLTMRHPRVLSDRGLRARVGSLALMMIVCLFTELGRLDTQVTWRLPVNLIASILGLYGMTRTVGIPLPDPLVRDVKEMLNAFDAPDTAGTTGSHTGSVPPDVDLRTRPEAAARRRAVTS